MIALAGGDLVLPHGVISGSLVVEGNRIAAVIPGSHSAPAGAQVIDVRGMYVVPGFVDVHVHGLEGVDTLDGYGAIAAIAARLPRHGVTAFCPTTVACPPAQLAEVFREVAQLRVQRLPESARVLPAHLESNFINPDYAGAQPVTCLRSPIPPSASATEGAFSAAEVLSTIAAARPEVGIVTLAPELPGAIDLIHTLIAGGHRVSLGHSGADFETAVNAIEAGARQATHLFNRMPPMTHRAPGLAGAVLARREVAAELICDGHHVHPAFAQMAIAAKGVDRIMAVTDATAGAGLAMGATARLGGRTIHVRETAVLDDGTLAGSTLTMNRAFHNLVTKFHCSIVDAAAMCAATPARELGLDDVGTLAEGSIADVVVLARDGGVMHTVIDGRLVFSAAA